MYIACKKDLVIDSIKLQCIVRSVVAQVVEGRCYSRLQGLCVCNASICFSCTFTNKITLHAYKSPVVSMSENLPSLSKTTKIRRDDLTSL